MPVFDLSDSSGSLHLEGKLPVISAPYFGWDYEAVLEARSLRAVRAVSDHDPSAFAHFFESLATNWDGWSGERSYTSLDHELQIDASHDGVRAITFIVRLRDSTSGQSEWSLQKRIIVEPSALAELMSAAQQFAGLSQELSPNIR